VLIRGLYSHVEPVPFLMFARGRWAASLERSLDHLSLSDLRHVQQSPARDTAAARPANLICQQLDGALLLPIIVRLDDALFAFVAKSQHLSEIDCRSNQLVELWIGCLQVQSLSLGLGLRLG
jgi:hypothetical protein